MNKRIKDLILEAEFTQNQTPETRLKATFDLISFSENLFKEINKKSK